ncbi:MAG: FAD-binding domain-containing protein [Pseudomonadota bacterium]
MSDDLNTPSFFPATQAHGQARLKDFIPQMGKAYAQGRNRDLGPEDRRHVSCLSPFLRHRLITEEEVLQTTLAHYSYDAAQKFIQEVYWRGYFKGWLEARPWVWIYYQQAVEKQAKSLSGYQSKTYAQAIEGQTEIECFNAWTKELLETGYLHNHARMWYASIWIFTLQLPWVLGADFFYRHLLDGDAASNTLSWRWVAGLHTKGKNYIARADNIRKYTGSRFAPAGQLAEDPTPLEDDWNGEAVAFQAPFPMLPTEKPLLVLHEEDLGVETLPLTSTPVAVAIYSDPNRRSTLPVSSLVKSFTAEAVADTAARAQEKWSVPVKSVSSLHEIEEMKGEEGAKTLIMPYAPQGPVQDALAPLQADILLRDYDQRVWPYCDKGFFKLKKKIEKLLPPVA